MTGPSETSGSRSRQTGAALVVALTLITAVGLLAAAAMREAIVETAMTRHMMSQAGARLAAFSALEMLFAESPFPLPRVSRRDYRLGPHRQFDATVSVVYLGEAPGRPGNAEATAATVNRHFEITAEIVGPNNVRHRRRMYRSFPVPFD